MATTGISPAQLTSYLLQGRQQPVQDAQSRLSQLQQTIGSPSELAPPSLGGRTPEEERLLQLQQTIGAPVPPPPVPVTEEYQSALLQQQQPGVLTRVLQQPLTTLGQAEEQRLGAEYAANLAIGEAGLGVATSIPAFFAGLGEMGSTLLNRAAQTIAERGPVTAQSAGEVVRAQPGEFYTGLRKQFQHTMEQYSYTPRTGEGLQLLAVAGMLPGVIQGGAELGKQALVSRGVRPEDADSVALSLELLGFLALEPAAKPLTRGMRSSIARFKSFADRVTSDADLARPEAVSAARDLAAKVRENPEVSATLQQARQDLAGVLSPGEAAQAPTVAAAQQRVSDAQAALAQATPETRSFLQLEVQRAQSALNDLVTSGPTAALPEPVVPTAPSAAELANAQQRVVRAQAELGSQYSRQPLPAREAELRAASAELARLQGNVEVGAAAPTSAPIEVTPDASGIPLAMERVARAEAALSDPQARTSLAVRAREFRAASADLARLRAAEDATVAPPGTRSPEQSGVVAEPAGLLYSPPRVAPAAPLDVPVARTEPAVRTVEVPPGLTEPVPADTTPTIKKPTRTPRAKIIVDTEPASGTSATVTPQTDAAVNAAARNVEDIGTAREGVRVGVQATPEGVAYHPVGGVNALQIVLRNPPVGGESGTSPVSIQVRTTGGRPSAILFDPTGLSVTSSIESIQRQVAQGKLGADVAHAMEQSLRRQANISNVPINKAHEYTAQVLETRLMQQALDRNLEYYQARRTSAGIKYEEVPRDVLRTKLGLDASSPMNPVGVTSEAAAGFVENKTRPVGPVTLAEMQRGLETLDRSLAARLPEDVRRAYTQVLDTQTAPMTTSEVRGALAYIKDIADLVVPPDIAGEGFLQSVGPAGPLALFSLTPARKQAALRLWADATQRKRTLREVLDQTTLTETDKQLILRYVNSVDKPALPVGVRADQPLSMEDIQANGDFVWNQREVVRDGVTYKMAPVHASDATAIQGMKELGPVQGLTAIGKYEPGAPTETAPRKDLLVPFYAMRRMDILDPVFYAARASQRAAAREMLAFDRDMRAMFRVHDKASRERVGEFGYSTSLQGMNILRENGRDVPTLNTEQRTLYTALRAMFDEMWQRVNSVREATGKPQLDYIEDYMPLMRVMSLAEKTQQRINLTDVTPQALHERVGNIAKMDMKRAETRTGATYKAEFDAAVLARDFMQQATEQIHMAPFIAKLDELTFHEMPDINTGEPGWKLSDHKPRAYEYLRDWRNYLVSGTTNSGMNPTARKVANTLMQNLSISTIGLAARSTMLQLDTLISAGHAIGPHWLAVGIGDLMADAGRFFFSPEGTRTAKLLRESQVMDTRGIQDAFTDVTAAMIGRSPGDFLQAVKSGGLRDVARALAPSVLYKTMETFDHVAATVTGLGAMRLGEHMGLRGRNLVNFTDDVIVRTNGGTMPIDVAGIQRSLGGRIATQFQRFLINDWNYLVEDVFGAAGRKDIARLMDRNPDKYVPAVVKSTLMYAAVLSAYNTFMEDVLGVQTSRPAPLRTAVNSQQAGDSTLETARKVALNLLDPLPFIGNIRHGTGPGGPLIGLGYQIAESVSGAPLSYKMFKEGDTLAQGAARLYGSPLARLLPTPGSRQAASFVRASDQDMGFWPSLMGFTRDQAQGVGGGVAAPSFQRPGQGIRRIR